MNRVIFSLLARQDLDDIFLFIARDKPRAAKEFVERIEESAEGLAFSLGLARLVPK